MLETRVVGLRGYTQRTFFYLVMIVLSALFFFPFYWLCSSSLKTDLEVFRIPPVWWPHTLRFDNYARALTAFPLLLYLKNTLVVCVSTVVGATLSCSLAAYSFACVDWPGRDAVFFLVISTMMIPYAVIMVPAYIIFHRIGWTGTPLPLIVPSFLGLNAFFIFLLRQFFKTLPVELFDAARMDGASDLFIYARIVVPLSRPALAVVALFQFMNGWNDFMGPLIYLSNVNKYTLALGLQQMMQTMWADWAALMAASLVVTLPLIVLYFFTQRTFIEGITLTGIKA